MNKDTNPKILFDESAKSFILDALGYGIDKKGFVVDEKGIKVKSNRGLFVHEKNFAGVRKDKKTKKNVFYTTDLVSLIDLIDDEDIK
jgi:hypothetical protein